MSLQLERLLTPTPRGVRALVLHAGEQLELEVIGPLERLTAVAGDTLSVEFDFDAVSRWRALDVDDPAAHGLFAEGSRVRVVGVARLATGCGLELVLEGLRLAHLDLMLTTGKRTLGKHGSTRREPRSPRACRGADVATSRE